MPEFIALNAAGLAAAEKCISISHTDPGLRPRLGWPEIAEKLEYPATKMIVIMLLGKIATSAADRPPILPSHNTTRCDKIYYSDE